MMVLFTHQKKLENAQSQPGCNRDGDIELGAIVAHDHRQ